MIRIKETRSILVVSLVMAGGLFLSISAKGPNREIEIEADCQVDYEMVNLSIHKNHKVKWTSDQTFDIDFGSANPCKNKPPLHVSQGHDSDWCKPDSTANPGAYKYSIKKAGVVCNDPGVTVKDGRDEDKDKNKEGKKPE
jgi:hypothetical protein